ncbi:MAG TPA: allantoicase [Kiritimatiellia bacterium]|nr:allantoicase [Kiritimatiellia bacterium]HMP33685.1 allantoicase [Kiritimatiellia bacterium]
MSHTPSSAAAFAGFIDLASEKIGGRALSCSDEFFAEKENLLKDGRGVFIADKFTERGKWMDGWETRRKRTPGYDWCILQLGLPGVIHGLDIDTNHFLGNNPAFASVEAALGADGPWTEILPRSPLNPGAQNLFAVANRQPWTHLRLNIYPDGGVARFRVYGQAHKDWSAVKPGEVIDLAAIANGGRSVACSDMFFSSMHNLIMPGRAANMGDGWETKRRRGPGYDWVIVKLGRPGLLREIEVDTNHFKGNYPDTCTIEGCLAPDTNIDLLTWNSITWSEVLPRQKLQASHQHLFAAELTGHGPYSHLKLNIFPDGGVSRLRVRGTIAP